MTADITPQLRLPVFDPDYNTAKLNSQKSANRRKQPASRDPYETPSSDTDDQVSDISSQPSSRKSANRRKPLGPRDHYETPSSDTDDQVSEISSSTTEQSKVTRKYARERERGRTAAGNDVAIDNGKKETRGRKTDGKEHENNQRKESWKWKPAKVNEDTQPIGVKAAQCRRKTSDLSENGRSKRQSSKSNNGSQTMPARSSNYSRFKYPVKFHRLVGSQTTSSESTFDVPDCLRRPTSIYFLPMKQGAAPTTVSSQASCNNTHNAGKTAYKSKNRRKRAPKGDNNNDQTLSSGEPLNGVYHITYNDKGRVPESGEESKEHTDPETAVHNYQDKQSSSSVSLSSTSDSETDDNISSRDKVIGSRRSNDEGNQAPAASVSFRPDSDDDDNYSADFVE